MTFNVTAFNLVRTLAQSLGEYAESPALTDYKGQTLRYGQVAGKISQLHRFFQSSRLKQGDKVALVGRNCVHWALVYLATITYGVVIVPILPDFHGDDIHHIVNHSDSTLLFAGKDLHQLLDEGKMTHAAAALCLDDFSLLWSRKRNIEQAGEELVSGDSPAKAAGFPEIASDKCAAIVYTSGTTGFSKGVMLSHGNLMANIWYARKSIALRAGHRILSFLPLAHAYGCAFEFLFPFSIGCHITLLGSVPSPRILLAAFQDIKPHLILSVPLILEKIYKKHIQPKLRGLPMRLLLAVPGVRGLVYSKMQQKLRDLFGGSFLQIVIGGAAMNHEVEAFLLAIGFPFTIGYGMTECAPLIAYAPPAERPFASVGRLVDTLEITIDSAKPGRVPGEIMVRGANVMQGYYKNAEATREAIDGQGWLHTGDLGLQDTDGFIYIKGRSKSMILGPSGQNIYPEEIESKLNNMPYVQESLVLQRNKQLMALVYPDMERMDAHGLAPADLEGVMAKNRRLVNAQLPAYSRLSAIELYPEEFEKTPTKKVKRFLYTIGSH